MAGCLRKMFCRLEKARSWTWQKHASVRSMFPEDLEPEKRPQLRTLGQVGSESD